MKVMGMNERLYKVLSQILNVPVEQITDEDSPNTLESWDSLTHVNLMLALEAEFNLSISPDEAAEMFSVGLIKTTLMERGVT